jgi:hypothetical protein
MKTGRGLTVERMVQLGRVSRTSFYRFDESAHPGHDADMDLRDAIQRIALEWPSYGHPRITAELRRDGWKVNPKRVYRILREHNLLCMMLLTGMDQRWAADITYIRLREEFVFVAVILEAFSRRVIGWALDQSLEDQLTLAALKMALLLATFQCRSDSARKWFNYPDCAGAELLLARFSALGFKSHGCCGML